MSEENNYEDYLLNNHRNEILNILKDPDVNKSFSVNISFVLLFDLNANLGRELLAEPETALDNFNKAAANVQNKLLQEIDKKFRIKNRVTCRIHSLPTTPDITRNVFPGNDDADKFLQISGTVIRMSISKLLEFQRQYICTKCKHSIIIKAEYDRKYMIKQPKKCQNPEGCKGTNFATFGELDSSNCKDYQEIRIQEDVSKLSMGTIPDTMWVTLEDDLVDMCKPGDSVLICGVVKRRWNEFSKGAKIGIDLCLKANHVEVRNSQGFSRIIRPEVRAMFDLFWERYRNEALLGRDLILKSFCPELYGLYLVKLAVAVVLAGGSQKEQDSASTGVRTRSESHLLLVGDPGTGKSQMLRFASYIIPRSVLTTGVGSTSAGLTATAVKESNEWQLEAGALVMSDGGACFIDEFNSMRQHDRDSIHEAMEQQSISIAKAGIVCKLNSRCSILAACNPKGYLDRNQPLCMNLALPSPLLSRFDLILLIKDAVVEEWDSRLADYILNGQKSCSKLTEQAQWTIEMLQAYFSTIRKCNPKLTEEANHILSTYYQIQRKKENRNKARTTVRLLDSLVRLSQGHARLMYHEKVDVCDSVFAIVLVDTAMDRDSSALNLSLDTHDPFPDNPLDAYKKLIETVLPSLGLMDVLEKEMEKIVAIVGNSSKKDVKSRFFYRKSSEASGGVVRTDSGGSDSNECHNEVAIDKQGRNDEYQDESGVHHESSYTSVKTKSNVSTHQNKKSNFFCEERLENVEQRNFVTNEEAESVNIGCSKPSKTTEATVSNNPVDVAVSARKPNDVVQTSLNESNRSTSSTKTKKSNVSRHQDVVNVEDLESLINDTQESTDSERSGHLESAGTAGISSSNEVVQNSSQESRTSNREVNKNPGVAQMSQTKEKCQGKSSALADDLDLDIEMDTGNFENCKGTQKFKFINSINIAKDRRGGKVEGMLQTNSDSDTAEIIGSLKTVKNGEEVQTSKATNFTENKSNKISGVLQDRGNLFDGCDDLDLDLEIGKCNSKPVPKFKFKNSTKKDMQEENKRKSSSCESNEQDTKQDNRNKKRKPSDSDIQNEVGILKLMPGVNDDFLQLNLDLDSCFELSLKQRSKSSNSTGSGPSSKWSMYEDIDDIDFDI